MSGVTRLYRGKRERDQEDIIQQKRSMQAHSTSHSSMTSAAQRQRQEAYTVEYLEQLLADDHHLDQETVKLLSVLLNKNWVLAQLESAEVKEFKWLKRLLKLKIFADHPRMGSPIQGEYRKFVYDDGSDGLKPLTPRQKREIDQLLMTIFAQDTRARQGWQQEQIGKTTQVSEYKDNSGQESKGLFSFG